VTDWAATILGVHPVELAQLALAADPRRSPVLAAFLDGERKPNRPAASGLLAGITSSTTREELARAVHDGVILGLLRGEARMNAAGISTSGRVLATGGGARSAAYQQILADLTGRDVVIADPKDANEATARGAAIQAAAVLAGTGVTQVRRDWAPRTEVVATPRRGTSDLHQQLLERYSVVADWTGYDGRAPR
jgi:xylulokinase